MRHLFVNFNKLLKNSQYIDDLIRQDDHMTSLQCEVCSASSAISKHL